ncbi:MAG: 3-oxo-tetronate 4-phosphate decarboxylase [Burkholderiales bacterium]|jgi:ribulose-5-phosphate 4-epimerase/fuculose-1-phosphate aldolase
MTEDTLRDRIAAVARSLFERGLTHGSTGNISARLADGRWLVTPTGSSFGTLDPARISLLDASGTLLAGDPPSKETVLHRSMYRERPRAGAVVHLHSTASVAVSVLAEVDPADVLPPLTAYYVMRVGTLPLVPYFPPGDPALADAVAGYASKHHAVLLANHGPVVAGRTLEAATDAVEELEATARLFLTLNGRACRCLGCDEVETLRRRFPIDC